MFWPRICIVLEISVATPLSNVIVLQHAPLLNKASLSFRDMWHVRAFQYTIPRKHLVAKYVQAGPLRVGGFD